MTKESPVRAWELVVSLPALGFCAVVAYNRSLIYSKGKWGLFNDHNLSIVALLLVAIIALLVTRPWRTARRLGPQPSQRSPGDPVGHRVGTVPDGPT